MTVLLLGLGAFGSILGRSSASVLRGLVSECASKQPPVTSLDFFSIEQIIAECTSGSPAEILSVFGELSGIFVNSEIWSLSVNRYQPSKYDGSLCLFLPAFLTFMLYFGSYCLRINTSTVTLPLHGSTINADHSGAVNIARQKAV